MNNACQECGKHCEPGEFHDYVECVRFRWSQPYVDICLIQEQAWSDIKSLLFVIDELRAADRQEPARAEP